jgi:hypothetical protein
VDGVNHDVAKQIHRALDRITEQLYKNPPPLRSPWLRPKEAAKYIGYTTDGLENLRRHNRGPEYSKINHKELRYKVDALDAWIEAKREGHEDRPAQKKKKAAAK